MVGTALRDCLGHRAVRTGDVGSESLHTPEVDSESGGARLVVSSSVCALISCSTKTREGSVTASNKTPRR